MPLTFEEAYKRVCPNGEPLVPNTKEFRDVMELMRQSGFVPFQDTLADAHTIRTPTTVEQAKPYITRDVKPYKLPLISKREWLSIEANRKPFLEHLNKNKK